VGVLDSLFAWMSIRENFALPTLSQDTRVGLISTASTRRRLIDYIGRLGIVLGDPEDAITTLSGGNQQKVVIARWLASGPESCCLLGPSIKSARTESGALIRRSKRSSSSNWTSRAFCNASSRHSSSDVRKVTRPK
jgi:hypothetical protein